MNNVLSKILILTLCMCFIACSENSPPLTKNDVASLETPNKNQLKNIYPDEIPTGRLPSSIRPESYMLHLTIDPDQDSFVGHNEIRIHSDVKTSHIYLHGKDLRVSKVQIRTSSGEVLNAKYKQVHETGIAKLTLDGVLPIGKSTIFFDYVAPFNNALEALYKVEDGGKNYAFTQFQAVSARLAFPSFDEPAFKTPYETSLVVKNEHKGFTNTPQIAETDLGNGMRRLDFAISQKLPSYLIAFSVGDLDVVEWTDIPANKIRSTPLPLRGLATKGKGKKLDYALKNTVKILESLEEYFRVPYPYEKLDIVAVPDFAFGAMENAGLIIYREQLLLLEEENMSVSQMRSYMNVHGHELAHQWFGNLVTPVWWDDIWLNEAFATWMAYSSNDNIFPEQKFRQTLMSRSFGAMSNDSLLSARQIRQPILSNDDIDSAFDSITYSKGGGILRMFESFIGPEQFQNGITHYMNKYAFSNTTANDFITAIGEKTEGVSAEVIRNAFNSFIEQPGIPYLAVESTCDAEKTEIHFSQSRYLPIGSTGNKNKTWKIPVCVSYEFEEHMHKQCELITKAKQSIRLSDKGCPSVVMPNAEGAGYYRFSLNSNDWNNIFKNQDKLSDEEMIAVNDSFTASINAGSLEFDDLMQIAPQMVASDTARVAVTPISMLVFIQEQLLDTKDKKDKLASVSTQLYKSKLNSMGYKTRVNDSANTTMLRNTLLNHMADVGNDKDVRLYLVNMAKSYTGYKTDNKLRPEYADANTINTALKIAVDELGVEFARHLVKLFETERDGTIRGRLLRAISSCKDKVFATEIRSWLSSDKIRDNEIYAILSGHMSDENLRPEMWNWFKNNIEVIKSRVSSFSQSRIPGIGDYFCTVEDKDKVENFFKPIISDISGGPRALDQTLETIDLCAAKVAHHKDAVNTYLEQVN